jgi:hypothetical protein
MNKRIRTALAAPAIAFAIAFSANQLGSFTWMSSDTAGGVKWQPMAARGIKPVAVVGEKLIPAMAGSGVSLSATGLFLLH